MYLARLVCPLFLLRSQARRDENDFCVSYHGNIAPSFGENHFKALHSLFVIQIEDNKTPYIFTDIVLVLHEVGDFSISFHLQ